MDADSDTAFMLEALREADLAAAHGDVPVGCLVVDETGIVLGRAHNRREVDHDPSAHAEVLAIRAAAAARRHWRLSGTTLYATVEPCPMCAGAIVNARIDRVVFGCDDPKAGALRSLYRLGDDPRLNHRADVQGGVLAEPCARKLQDFFRALRAAGQK